MSRSRHPASADPAARFLALQRKLGNTLHTSIDLGHGVTLTWGQVLAIAGDEIGTVEELLADPSSEEGRHRLGASMLNAELQGPLPAALQPTKAQIESHSSEFQRLALENVDHFPDSGKAVGAWSRHHGLAVETALTAGFTGNRRQINAAYAAEAFGQHFLTDCYSGGHIRTPRSQIIDWYQEWAKHAADRLVAGIKQRLIDDLLREASPQTSVPDFKIRSDIADDVGPRIDAAIDSKAGGMANFRRMLGLGIAGAISGTIHDSDGAAGVEVASDDHPEPWLAYGDGKLKRSPTSFEQAAKAIAAAKAEVDRAYTIGAEEAKKGAGGSNADTIRAAVIAEGRVRSSIGPPFKSVSKFIPRPMPERKPGTEWAYKPVPEWRWGKLGWKFADTVDEYIRSIVGSQLRDKLAGAGVPDVINRPVPVTGTVITIHPRRAVDALLRDFSTSPLGTVSALIGEQATLPSPTPPGSKTPPIAPPEPGEDPEPDPSVPWPGGTPLPY